jgi:GMP synthase (glutamine-hydrolysing)
MRARILVLETMPVQSWLGAGSSGTGWLRALLPDCELVAVPAYDGETPLPDARSFGGVIVPGSIASVTERADWMLRLEEHLRGLAAGPVPLLGICFGHQILASALGGRVTVNPLGREFAIAAIRLTDAGRADPLFEGLGDVFQASQGHYDTVAELPPGATLLAENGYGVQGFALDNVRGIQFHPEITPSTLALIADYDAEELRAAGRDPAATAAAWRAQPRLVAERVVPNFVAAALARREVAR